MLRNKIVAGERLVGTFSLIPSTDVVEMIGLAGFDFVILDMEHGPYTLETLRTCLIAARLRGLPAIARVPDVTAVGAVLDLGCDGVLVPRASSPQAVREVVREARFTPDGGRGANPYVRAADFGGGPDWLARANREVAVMVMVEGVEGVAALPEILDVPGLDAIFMGPVDLSHALGVPGQPGHPRVLAELAAVAGKAAARGVAAAVFAPDTERARAWLGQGVPVVACGVDAGIIRTALAGVPAAVRE